MLHKKPIFSYYEERKWKYGKCIHFFYRSSKVNFIFCTGNNVFGTKVYWILLKLTFDLKVTAVSVWMAVKVFKVHSLRHSLQSGCFPSKECSLRRQPGDSTTQIDLSQTSAPAPLSFSNRRPRAGRGCGGKETHNIPLIPSPWCNTNRQLIPLLLRLMGFLKLHKPVDRFTWAVLTDVLFLWSPLTIKPQRPR